MATQNVCKTKTRQINKSNTRNIGHVNKRNSEPGLFTKILQKMKFNFTFSNGKQKLDAENYIKNKMKKEQLLHNQEKLRGEIYFFSRNFS